MESNAFVKTLTDLRKGQTVSELSDALTELVEACKRTGKKGEMTLKLKLTPSSDGETIIIQDDPTVKLPRMDRKNTTFFTTEDNRLQRNNPKQQEFDPKVIPNGEAEVKATAATAAS